MNSYQRRKEEIRELKRALRVMNKRMTFYLKAIWKAREATGERIGISPFCDMEGNEECLDLSFEPEKHGKYLLELIRGLPVYDKIED